MLRMIMTHMRHCVRGTMAACTTVLLVAAPWVAASSAAAAAVPAAAGHGLKKVHDPGRVTGTIHGHCTYRDHGQLPDPRCTPGSIDPHVTQADIRSTICKKGWTATVRPPESQTERFKKHVAFPAYGLSWPRESELDHEVPLELGGSNDATNLWPEVGRPSGNPKDKVENALNAAVCKGRVSLTAAQNAIAADWLTAENKLVTGQLPLTTELLRDVPIPCRQRTACLLCRQNLALVFRAPSNFPDQLRDVTEEEQAQIGPDPVAS